MGWQLFKRRVFSEPIEKFIESIWLYLFGAMFNPLVLIFLILLIFPTILIAPVYFLGRSIWGLRFLFVKGK